MSNSSEGYPESEDSPGTSGGSVGYELPLLSVVCLLGICGNLLTWLVYCRKKYRRSNAVIYILSLAAGDLMAIVVVIFHITEFFPVTWPIIWAYDWQCSVHRFYRFVGFNITVFTMTAIAVDRFYAVRHPVAFRTRFTAKRTRLVVGAVWALSHVAAVPTAFMFQSIYGGSGKAVTYPGKIPFACKLVIPLGTAAWFKDFKAIYLNIVLFYLPVIITAALYVVIVLHVWKNNKFVSSRMGRVPHRNSHWKTAKTLLTVFVVYVACFILLITYNLLARYSPNLLPPEVKNVGLLLPYVNCCLNPIVYSFSNPSFRKACRDILSCKSLGRNQPTMTGSVKDTELNSSEDPMKENNGDRLPRIPPPSIAVIQASFSLYDKQTQTCDDDTKDSNTVPPTPRDCDTHI